jgi:TolB-like protein/DNA-binding winged helix-turn-helix (wHTH) protein/Tfp pilus assembly protein PilF
MVVQVRKIYFLGEFTLDPDKKLLTCEGVPIHLANRPFQVLLHLIENRDRMVSRTELLDLFWDGKDVYENTLTKCVGAIRKAFNENLEQPRFIETQWAKGYRFIGTLEENFSQTHHSSTAQQASSFDIEKTRGFKVIVEEEYLEILPDSETVAQTNLPEKTTTSTSLLAKVFKIRQTKFSPRQIASAIVVALVLLLAMSWLAFHNRTTATEAHNNSFKPISSPIDSIAVLPLKNLSDDAANEYFSDGLTETFITELSKIEHLKVISRNSVFALKGKDIDPREIGKKLDVAAILEGSVRRNGDTVRVDVRLVNTKDGSIIWSGNSYDRNLKDLLAVQDEIACSVAAGLRVRFCTDNGTSKRYTTNVDAYQAYLKGRYFWNKRTPDGIQRSIEHFEQAIAVDLNYALAYAGLADSYIQGVWHVPFDPKEVLPKAKAAALQAIKIDDQLAEAHTALANVYQMEWQWAAAEKEMDRAIALNPGLARAYHVQAFQLDIVGRHNEAVAAIKQAHTLDPLNLVINADMSFILWRAGQPDAALAQALKAVEMDPGFAFGHEKLSDIYLFQGREDAAAEEYLKALMLGGKNEALLAAYRKAFVKNGLAGIHQKELEEQLQKQRRGGYGSPIRIAGLYAMLGQKEQAFKYLEVAYQQRSAEMAIIKQVPVFDPLRSDSRFQDLLRRIGLGQ